MQSGKEESPVMNHIPLFDLAVSIWRFGCYVSVTVTTLQQNIKGSDLSSIHYLLKILFKKPFPNILHSSIYLITSHIFLSIL